MARCLELVEVKNEGYPIKFFELAFVNFREKGVRVTNLRRRRVLRTLLAGRAHPDYNAWIDRLEQFCEMVKDLNYGKPYK